MIECRLERTNGPPYIFADGSKSNDVALVMTIDGYHAPLMAGNFVDLVERKFYDGLSIQSVDESLVQTGNPENTRVDGFIDRNTKKKCVIPWELFYERDAQPTYQYTSDDEDKVQSNEGMANPLYVYGILRNGTRSK